jgi:hypothetical protein
MASFALLMFVSRHITVARQDSLVFGFRGGPVSDDERMTRVGETRYFRAALIWSCGVRLRVRQNSEPQAEASPL